jgi:hypothetical protein
MTEMVFPIKSRNATIPLGVPQFVDKINEYCSSFGEARFEQEGSLARTMLVVILMVSFSG